MSSDDYDDYDVDDRSDGVEDEEMQSLLSDDVGETYEEEEQAHGFKVHTKDSLLKEMDKAVDETASVVGLSAEASRVLLRQFKWNREMLLEKFCDPTSSTSPIFSSARTVSANGGSVLCGQRRIGHCAICLEEKRRLKALVCHHAFCEACWERYLEEKIVGEGVSFIACPQTKCALKLDDKAVHSLLSKEEKREAYRKLEMNEFVESDRAFRWCPGVGCDNAVRVDSSGGPVRCDCGTTFCFDCGHSWHEPVNCSLMKMWLKKCSDDSETSNWLNTNTKDCPKCHVTIEKDGGCNHMTCKDCKAEFCWMCLGPWQPHGSGWYSCNRYDDEAAKKARDAQEKSRAALARWLHYFNRYQSHYASLKLESKLYAAVAIKMERMQKEGYSWVEVQFLEKAVDVLSESRKTLMYTYAFAYYLISSLQNNTTKIFEDNQRDLEIATEQLSEFLERDLDSSIDLIELKQKVQDKYRYVAQRRSILLKHYHEGAEKDEWVYSSDAQNSSAR